MRHCTYLNPLVLLSLLLVASMLPTTNAFIQKIERDFQALTRKVTAHHILLPKSKEVALALKQRIRNKISPPKDSDIPPMYIVDAFSAAAKKYSRDEETAVRGGLLGTLVKQGYCRARELDQACFQVPLGEICGPIESDYGYHLLLVVERTNCKKLDGQYTNIIRGVDGTSKVFVGDASEEEAKQMFQLVVQQVGFWFGVTFAGGVVAEVAAKAANVVDTLPWE
mmetsp:Transcript_36989/g.66555  ORF Transcript_36989/g.66555 Transcript_36989/m.66555 type:complete len:224 (+) Transcript_36989:183-854(+)|eukprot:CAMPEP_0201873616 /NCGR_PEP_ID=MMETSP0902-20130614/6067_1 /ASSEMBLY_ACC=CAM_ASM_000551 /TAXON_ID=420261 /ORGANISM="Thalassiosira antarctica, Strain CCMP982" /LENGTH=223 /DNA_ID=CAMNT_0048400259 /DNA_START=79 /DNA_END=750 /DNA_ORIENTATION=+